MEENFIKYIEQSIKDHWDLPALTDFKGATSSYKDVARKIEKLHLLFEHCGIRKGDKIALCSRNQTNWGIAFLAILSYGAVAVPILHEFKADNIRQIIRDYNLKTPVYVGDTLGDFNATKDAGIPFVFASYGFGQVSSPDYTIQCPGDLLNIF